MRSTGEVMGISDRFSIAFAKSQLAAGTVLPREGNDLSSASHERHKPAAVDAGQAAERHGLFDPRHRRARPRRSKRPASSCQRVKKLQEGHPNLLDYFADRKVALVMNTPSGKGARTDEGKIRAAAVQPACPASRRSKRPPPPCTRWKRCATKRCRCRRCRIGFARSCSTWLLC